MQIRGTKEILTYKASTVAEVFGIDIGVARALKLLGVVNVNDIIGAGLIERGLAVEVKRSMAFDDMGDGPSEIIRKDARDE